MQSFNDKNGTISEANVVLSSPNFWQNLSKENDDKRDGNNPRQHFYDKVKFAANQFYLSIGKILVE